MKTIGQAQNSSPNAWVIACLLLLAGLVGYTVIQNINHENVALNPVVAFQFDTYCPIDSQQALDIINDQLASQGVSPLNFDFKINRNIYVVNTQSRPSDPNNPNSSALLYYCGFAKKWWEDSCTNARFICSIPGPMFYFPVKQEATIIWINTIQFKNVNYTRSNCYDDQTSTDHDCSVSTKPSRWQNCTFYEATDYQYLDHEKYRIRADSVPISPHIHGLEIRPTFDGNPLSWFNTKGNRGSGFQTLYNQDYFAQFNNVDTFKGKQTWAEDLKQRSKVIKVTNDQAPGLLFYHDHAMKSTLYNVQYGLGGLWVIYDPKVEANLPSGNYEKFIVFSKQGDARTQSVRVRPDAYTSNNDIMEFQRSATYRFRILNAAFDNTFNNVVFAAYYTIQQKDGQYIYTEIDPSDTTYDLDSNKHLISFSVIGTDTTLFSSTINNVDFLNFGPAERVDLLIRFDTDLPQNINNVYFVCDDQNEGKTVIKYQFNIQKSTLTLVQKMTQIIPNAKDIVTLSEEKTINQRLKYPKDYPGLDLPYTNLSNIPDSKIQVRRNRPLFSLPYDTRFMIGAHYMFQEGGIDRPKIGTVDQFYIINNLWQDHPIHIHLINHQAVKAYSLKRLPENTNCTLYFLDYFRQSGLQQFQDLDNLDLCNYLWQLDDQEVLDLFDSLSKYMLQNQVILTDKGKVSGLDVMALSNGDQNYVVGDCSLDLTHKYICEDTSGDILQHEKRWKDTTMVHLYQVFVLRVRWASTLYDSARRPYPFFNIPEQHLVEFPGFVYHCHILPHQDNEMMRGFTLQYSDFYKNTISPKDSKRTCARDNWWDQMKCINDRLKCPMIA